ncbi:MAG: hypothetical protein H7138_20535, partial [Myxococcales bacterium]|nr:hypothetical protein [Myxococcales bacterium]
MTASAEGPSYGPYELLAKIAEGPRGPAFVARLRSETVAEPRYVVELHAFATGEEAPQRTFHHDLARAAQLHHKQVLRVVETDNGFAMHWELYADKARQLKAISDEVKKADRDILAT